MARAVVDDQVVVGDVSVDDGVITAVGLTPAGSGGWAVPGFVDLQINGFAGIDLVTADVDGYRHVGEQLVRTGVVAYQPTLISSPLDAYPRALQVIDAARGTVRAPRIVGAHLEGPFLSPDFAGAHDPAHLREPDLALAERLLEAGPVSTMTLAPELPGGLELVAWLTRRGVIVSLGHCAADATIADQAFDRGARAITHLHNAQRRWQARDPGVSGVALTRRDVVVTAIVDHVHLAPETSWAAFQLARGRFALITDAVMAAGLPAGDYHLGDREVHVLDGEVRLPDGTLAGSVLTMDQAFRNLVGLGATISEAVAATSVVPARLLGRPDVGTMRPGASASITVLDEALAVERTLVAGEVVHTAT